MLKFIFKNFYVDGFICEMCCFGYFYLVVVSGSSWNCIEYENGMLYEVCRVWYWGDWVDFVCRCMDDVVVYFINDVIDCVSI